LRTSMTAASSFIVDCSVSLSEPFSICR
jgi:hypothetical protein